MSGRLRLIGFILCTSTVSCTSDTSGLDPSPFHLIEIRDSTAVDVAGVWDLRSSVPKGISITVARGSSRLLDQGMVKYDGVISEEPCSWMVIKRNGVESKRPTYCLMSEERKHLQVVVFAADTIMVVESNPDPILPEISNAFVKR